VTISALQRLGDPRQRLPLDRPPLPAPGRGREERLTPTQAGLSHLWSDLLNNEQVSLDDDFFALGGNSLKIEVSGIHRDMHDRYITHRQHVRIGEVNGLAADLHRKLRSADRGGADALAGIDQRQATAPA